MQIPMQRYEDCEESGKHISPPKVTNKASVTDREEIKTVKKKRIQNNPLKEVHETVRIHKEKNQENNA